MDMRELLKKIPEQLLFFTARWQQLSLEWVVTSNMDEFILSKLGNSKLNNWRVPNIYIDPSPHVLNWLKISGQI